MDQLNRHSKAGLIIAQQLCVAKALSVLSSRSRLEKAEKDPTLGQAHAKRPDSLMT